MRGTLHPCLLVCAFALTLAGCGSGDDGTIPQDDAETMLNYIEAAQDAVQEGDCGLAADNATELIDVINGLPNDVDPEVASELTKAAENMRALASDPDECGTGPSGEEGPQPTDTTETDTTSEPTITTTTTEEETTTEETTTEEEPEEEPAPEPEPEPESPEPEVPGPGGGNPGGGNVTPTPGGGLEPPSGGVQPGGNAG